MVNYDFNATEINFETICRQDHRALVHALQDQKIPSHWRKAYLLSKTQSSLDEIIRNLLNGFQQDRQLGLIELIDDSNKNPENLKQRLEESKKASFLAIDKLQRLISHTVQKGEKRASFKEASVLIRLLETKLQLTCSHILALIEKYRSNIDEARTSNDLKIALGILATRLHTLFAVVEHTEANIKETLDSAKKDSYSNNLKALFLTLLFQTLKRADGVYEDRSLGVSVLDPDSTLKKDNLFFRGHGDERWSLSSSLIRVVLSQIDGASTAISPDIFESGLNVIELQSIDVARRNGLVRNLGAFTLTAVLQHHESPTRLLDVSQDWRIALYFASTNEAHCDGRVFIFYTNTTLTKLPVDNDYLPWDQRSVDNPHWGKATFLVKTPAIDSRMIAQAGHFLCGSTDFYAKSYVLGKSISETVGKCSVNVDFPVWHRPRTSLTTLQALVRELETHQNTNINGASIVFDKDLKPLILDILSKDTADPIHHDVIYPPVSDVKRLLHHVAMEHLPLSLRIFSRKAERS